MLELKIFVCKCFSVVDVDDSSSVVVNKISALYHEVFDDTMKTGAFEAVKDSLL